MSELMASDFDGRTRGLDMPRAETVVGEFAARFLHSLLLMRTVSSSPAGRSPTPLLVRARLIGSQSVYCIVDSTACDTLSDDNAKSTQLLSSYLCMYRYIT